MAITNPNADILLNDTRAHIYAALDVATSLGAANGDAGGTSFAGSPVIGAALNDNRPLLFVVLGEGNHD